ncbi:MAG: SRPBCC domain-containing protein [Actinobacteria bacterium]|nr:SRPBCC domain-containing protein [Actinomycetota bacterium]
MSAVDISKDLENATLVVSSEFAAAPERIWRLWADPRQLERWWGPEPYAATVVDHDLRPGGHVSYYMTGPEGDQHKGFWRVLEVEPPARLVFEDGFADDAGEPNDDLPVSRAEVAIASVDGGRTRMTITSTYGTTAELEQVLAMGMEEGIRAAVGQIDALLAED